MDPAEAKRLWASTKANHAALAACAGPHEFVDVTPEKVVGKEYCCKKCDGKVDSTRRFWYEEGLRHARAEDK